MKKYLIWFPIFLLVFSSCSNKSKQTSSQNKGQLKGEIQLSGAFALYPLAVKWAAEFKKLHPDVTVDVSGGGAGKGITDALAGVVDLGMVSRELKPEELKKGAVPFAVAKDAVVATINSGNPELKDIEKTGLKKEIALQLWSGKISSWGQVVGNSNRLAVHVFTRSDACGAAETFAKWLGGKQEDLKGTAVFGDPGVSSAVQKDKLGIGYNNLAYAYDQKTQKPFAGITVVPIDFNDNGKIDKDEDFYKDSPSLKKAILDGKYKSPLARKLYLVAKGKPEKPLVKEFLKFILSKGQEYEDASGYIGLPPNDLKKELSGLK